MIRAEFFGILGLSSDPCASCTVIHPLGATVVTRHVHSRKGDANMSLLLGHAGQVCVA